MNKISCIMGKEPLLHVHTAKGQASLSFHAGSPELMLFAHISGRPKGNLAKKTRCDLNKGSGMCTERLI